MMKASARSLVMRKLVAWVLALVALTTGVVRAQTIAGNWQGTLEAGRPLRVVVKIATGDAGSLSAVMYSIDQGGQPLAASAVSLQALTFKFSVPGIGASYEGKLSADGASMTGTFTQGGTPLPLNLVRATGDAAWAIPAPPAAMRPMPADARPVFEVASIKPSNPDAQGKLFTIRGRQVLTINTTVNDLITFAYGLHPRQIAGGPAWLETEKFDVTGQPDIEGVPSQPQLRLLVERLLADRFKLTFHREKKELSVYAIVVGNKGPTLTKSAATANSLPSLLFRGLGVLPAANASIADLAMVMQQAVLDRPVVDQTGLAGRFDFTLTWTPDETQFQSMGVRIPPRAADAPGPPGLFTAIQEQLGLKFESTKAAVDVIVVDQIQRPSPN
jgi:uncharacterized protein (TIGR03435 family)